MLVSKEEKIQDIMKKIFRNKSHELEVCTEKIIALNPLSVLKRGYSITKIGDKVIKESSQVKLGDSIETTIKNGKIISRIEEII